MSTDEVYGTLKPGDAAFSETSLYAPNSPYAASKAASDLLVRAWLHTYKIPTLTVHASNNYGPYQFPEKFIPLVITHALRGKRFPVYGDGLQVRDWLFVLDHCKAIVDVLSRGKVGETYNIGGGTQRSNLEVVQQVCALLDEMVHDSSHKPHADLMYFVEDRIAHDRRYAVNSTKIRQDVGWSPLESFETGLRQTVAWYLSPSGMGG